VTAGNGYDRVLQAADGAGIIERQNGSKFSARCPSHEDGRASLSVARGDDGRALIHCFAGCDTPLVVAALGLDMKDLFNNKDGGFDVAQYVYTDEAGDPLIRVTRTWPKSFRQERWDPADNMWKNRLFETRRVLYNLPEVVGAEHVWVVEGEKDVETLRGEGVVGTTLLGGAGNWKDEYLPSLRDKHVDIIADNDQPGIEGAMRVKNALRGSCKGLGVWKNPHGKDVTDLFNQGYGLKDLERHVITDGREFEEMDWERYEAPEVDWLLDNYIPANSRVMAYGPAGSLKSLWAMWVASQLAKEGHKAAYFSLEMQPKEVAKRLKKLNPPRDRFKLFRRLSFESSNDLAAACDLLKGYSLIVVDSWSAAQRGNSNDNDAVARLDQEFFLPLIEETGATLLILDNTGQAILTERGKVQPDWARGASSKGDKMDQNLMFERPDEDDNHKVRIRVKKVRGDASIPKPITVKTDNNNIDFRVIDDHDVDLGSMWHEEGGSPPPPEPKPDAPPSLLDRLREAREAAKLKEEKL